MPIFRLVPLLLGIVLFTSGCGTPQKPVEEARLSKLAVLYGRFISQHKGKTPANEAEFKAFIGKMDSEVKVDELFVSPRDNEPFVVRYNLKATMPGEPSVTAYEKTGVSGKKMVALATGQVQEMDDAELQKKLGGKK